MRRLLTATLALALAAGPVTNFAPAGSQASAQPANQEAGRTLSKLSRRQQQALREAAREVTEIEVNERAVPTWLTGDLGEAKGEPRAAAVAALRRLGPVFRASAEDDFKADRPAETDELGQTHVRIEQRHRGLRVVGARLTVHLQKGRVIGVNGTFVPEIEVNETPGLRAEAALGLVRQRLEAATEAVSEPELVVYAVKGETPRLAWAQHFSFETADGAPQKEVVYADANTGDLIARHSLIKDAKFRKVYDANNTFTAPGTLRWQETSPWFVWLTLDAAEKGAATGTGHTYNFFWNAFGRDSYDGAGGQLKSTVHYGNNHNNAYWDSSLKQMKYGDGDGVKFSAFSLSLDVTAHELTHGLTDATADLIYSGESGALNEAMSDIFAECTENFVNGAPDWKIGEDIYTPGVAGDALRYMYDPVLDDAQITHPDLKHSRDYYPDRYTGGADFGGVHINSGIANLAFYLLTVGGTHPRGKTTVAVPGIGITKAQKIFYRALTVYMDPDDTFADARAKTIKAAADLYGGSCSAEAKAVKKAWRAVGVGPTLVIDFCDIVVFPFPPLVDGK
jgi:Zn-dependent metalloprotease